MKRREKMTLGRKDTVDLEKNKEGAGRDYPSGKQ